LGKDTLLEISELFYSIQGESSFAGYPCFFIRLAGCNLRCTYCDARYTYEEPGSSYSVESLLAETKRYPDVLVEITGGEPLLQEGIYPLLDKLLQNGRTVLLETNGSLGLEKVPEKVIKIMDVKCPDSGMHEQMDFKNFVYLASADEIKFVISSRQDYDFAKETLLIHNLLGKSKLSFSPLMDRLAPYDLAKWIMDDRLPVRLQLQLHTILWPDKKRGY
jgi:7-carboxy-7-deazaguanine synthase